MRCVRAPLLASVAVVAALGFAHGVATDRWAPSSELVRAVDNVGAVPTGFGDWAGEDVTLEPETLTRAGIRGWTHRRYRNRRTHDSVVVLLVCGRGGPLSVHTPDVCYAGAGYQPVGNLVQKEVEVGPGERHAFRVGRFARPGGVSQTQLEVYWAWSRDGREWVAPDNPRLHLARLPALYKLYVVREFLPNTRSESEDACQAFLRRAIPELLPSRSPELPPHASQPR
jgi:hypothetical protein